MLGSVAVSEIQQILGFRSDQNQIILNALQYAQTEREKPGLTFPWWLWQEDTPLSPLTIGSQTLALPTGFIQDSESIDANLRYNSGVPNTRTVFLKKMDYKTAEQHYFGVWQSDYDCQQVTAVEAISPGPPKAYVLRQNSIRVYPAPDQAYVMTWSFWGADATISLTTENQWLKNAPWVLIGDAAKKVGSDLNNSAAVATASEILTRAEQNMFRSVIHREEAGRSRSMGSRL